MQAYNYRAEARSLDATVIIAAYEQAPSLHILLTCLSNQSFNGTFEVVVCDDGSVPAMQDLLPSYPALRIRYVWQEHNQNRVAKSRNNGIRLANGKYLIFLDGDIVVGPCFVARHVEAHRDRATVLVCNKRRWCLLSEAEINLLSSRLASDLTIQELLGRLDETAVEVDYKYQMRDASGREPWLACLGFCFSVGNHLSVFYDETFKGWGPEDREFALRLYSKHGYSIDFRHDIEVFHLDCYSTARLKKLAGPEETVLPQNHEDIVMFFRNVVYLADLYPVERIKQLLKLLLFFQYKQATGTWEYTPLAREVSGPIAVNEAIVTTLAQIRFWLGNSSTPSKHKLNQPAT